MLIIFKEYILVLLVLHFRFSETLRTRNPDVNKKSTQTFLRAKCWMVPNYELAPNLSHMDILPVAVRLETVSRVLIEWLVPDIVDSQDTACASMTQALGL